MDRRQFITLAASASLGAAAGCPLLADAGDAQVIDAGPVGAYAAEGVYDAYRDLGFFVIRQGGKLSALSSICTHRHVTLTAKHDCTFDCKRHGSTFDRSGHVTKGPAKNNLPMLFISVNVAGHLLVTLKA
jgi:Rieske Fe-S protein